MKYRISHCLLASLFWSSVIIQVSVARGDSFASAWDANASPAFAALSSAAQQGHYAFVVFWKEDNPETQRMFQVVQSAVPTLSVTADIVNVPITDPNESSTVEEFGVDRAPMPLLIAVAPNGAITNAWPLQCDPEKLRAGIVSTGTAESIKGLQEGKLVFVSVQNKNSAHRQIASLAIDGFRADPRFANVSESIVLDPADPQEATFLHDLGVDTATKDTVTVLLAPPGKPIAKFVGMFSTEEIVAKITAAQSGCCPGGQCGPGGCCPGGKCGPQKDQ